MSSKTVSLVMVTAVFVFIPVVSVAVVAAAQHSEANIRIKAKRYFISDGLLIVCKGSQIILLNSQAY